MEAAVSANVEMKTEPPHSEPVLGHAINLMTGETQLASVFLIVGTRALMFVLVSMQTWDLSEKIRVRAVLHSIYLDWASYRCAECKNIQ